MIEENNSVSLRKDLRARPLPVMIMAAAGMATWATQALADADYIKRGPDTVVRNQTVLQRQRPIYDPKGVELGGGGLVLMPSVDVSESYNDNVYATKTAKQNDFITVVSPRFDLKSRWSRHSFAMSASANINRYKKLDTENTNEFEVNASGTLDLPQKSLFSASGGYQRVTVQRGDPEQGSIPGKPPEQLDIASGKLEYSHPFGRVTMSIDGKVDDYKSVDSLDIRSNRTEYRASVRAAYEISAALHAFVEPFYSIRRYDKKAVDRDVDILGTGFGVTYDITGQLYGETSIGYYSAKFDNPLFKDSSGIFVRSEATWNLSALTSLVSGIERGNQASKVGTASSSTTSAIDFKVEHELARNVTAAITARYEHQLYDQALGVGLTRTDDFIQVGWIANYLLDRHVALFLKYDFEDRSSNSPGSEYTDNRVMVGIKGQL